MKVTIIGAGHSGFTAAAALQRKGIRPLLYTRKGEKAARLMRDGLALEGQGADRFYPRMTADLEEAVTAAEVILVDTWANAHREVFSALKPFLKADQILLVLNGNWGAYEAWQILREETARLHIAVGETSSQIFLGHLQYAEKDAACAEGMPDPSDTAGERRIPTGLRIKAVKERVSAAGVTRRDTARIREKLDGVLTELTEADSIFATSLSSANPIIHAPLSLFHLSQIERGEDFFFLSSTSQSVLDYTEHMDEERRRIARCLRTGATPALEEMNGFWGSSYRSLAELFRENPAYNRLKGPSSLRHRFFAEDLPFGSQPVEDLARLFGEEVPYTSSILAVHRLVLGELFPGERVIFRREEIEWLLNNNGRT